MAIATTKTLWNNKKITTFEIFRPNTGRAIMNWNWEELRGKADRVADMRVAQNLWQTMYARTEDKCLHHYLYGTCSTSGCINGMHKREDYVLRLVMSVVGFSLPFVNFL